MLINPVDLEVSYFRTHHGFTATVKAVGINRSSPNEQGMFTTKRMIETSWNPNKILQCEAPKISKLVYNSNNYGLWYL